MFWGTLYRANLRGETRSRIDACFVWGIAFFFVVLYPIAVWMIGYSRAYSLGYSLGVLLFIVGTRVIRIEWRPLAWLGVISYSIYLFHPVVFSPVLHWMRHLPPDSWWRSWHLGSYVIAVLLLTIAFAAIVYRFVEKPGIELGRRLARRWFTGERDARRGDGLVPAASAAE
jgi:peptidoglycan/LPS O-acetylase OafA/YrhL